MKILLTHELFPPDFAGGGEYVVGKTAQHLIERGIDVSVVTTGDPADTDYHGIPTVRLPIHRYRMNLAWRAIAEMARDVDIIHTFNYHAALPALRAARKVGKPVVCQILALFRDAWLDIRGPVIGRMWRRWERYLITRPYARVIFASEWSLRDGMELGVDPRRSVVNNPGIEPAHYAPNGAKEDTVLFVGKLTVRKGLDDLLHMAADVPEAKFQVMGWGKKNDPWFRSAPPNVEFVEFERGEKLHDTFRKARIFLFPSKAETFGIALVEAMAAGCAIVSTIPLPFAGARVRVGDRNAMAQAVRRLWNDREETERLGRQNIELARQYTWDRYSDRLLALYEDVLHDRNPQHVSM